MISDGLGTLIGALLGSPFGTVIYIGHPGEHKCDIAALLHVPVICCLKGLKQYDFSLS